MSGQYALLLRFDPHGLRDAAKAWKALAHAVDSAATRHRSQVNGPLRQNWQGGDARAAFGYMERSEQQLDVVRVEAEAAALALTTVADRMDQARTNLTNAVHRAQDAGLTVSPEGVVSLPAPGPGEHNDPEAQAARGTLARSVSGYQERINAALKAAQEASDQGAKALGRLDADILDAKRGNGAVAETRLDAAEVMKDLGLVDPNIPDGKDPKRTAEWWKGLTPEQQSAYLALRPADIGRLDGLPSPIRDKANRLVLDQKLDDLQAKTPAEAGLDPETYQKRRAALETIKDKLDERDGLDETKRTYLLLIDPEAYDSDGKAIVATGNPDTARHTTVFVPGTNTELAGVPGQIDRIRQLQFEAEKVAKSGESVSVISYLGYDAPESIPEAVNPMRGKDGAADLRTFSTGLRASHGEPNTHLTVIGHSYGSYAVGVAAKDEGGLGADDIIALGSPGMGVPNAAALNIDPNRVWVSAADDDPIRVWGGQNLGAAPHIMGFGGHNLKTDTEGHGGYWDDRSTSLVNQAKIMVGQPPKTTAKELPIVGNIPDFF